MRNRAWMQTCYDKAGDMSNISQQVRADFSRNLPHFFKIDDAWISAGSDCDHFRLMLASHFGKLLVVNTLILFADAVMHDLEEFAREVCLVAMRQVAAMS